MPRFLPCIANYRQYWLDQLELVLTRLGELCAMPESVQPRDWRSLKDLSSRSASDVTRLFYPGAPADVLDNPDAADRHRAKGFLAALAPSEYHAAYRFVVEHPELAFPDIEAAHRGCRKEVKIISQVISHAVRWVNPEPAAVEHRMNNKPQHWEDFVPALAHLPRREAKDVARRLQRDIFAAVRGRWDELEGSLQGDTRDPSYLERFSSPVWHEILMLVHRVIGPHFHGQLEAYNKELPSTQPGPPASALSRELCRAILHMPEVRGNPALHTPDAVQSLVERILPAVAEWALERCNDGIEAQEVGTMEAWSPSVAQQVHAKRLVFQEMVQTLQGGAGPRQSSSDGPTVGAKSPECPLGPSQIDAPPANVESTNFRPIDIESTNFRPINTPTKARNPESHLSDAVLGSFGLDDMASRRRALREAAVNQARPTIPGTRWVPPVTTMERINQSLLAKPLGTHPKASPAWASRRRANPIPVQP